MANILIVDDEVSLRTVIAAALKKEGHTVEEAGDGRSAVRWMSTHSFDLVISDVLMPEADGIEMIMRLRDARNPTPIIAITGGHLQTDLLLKVAKSLGARRVLAKPFKISELLALVKEVLEGKPEPDAK
jgi:two-component system OmpR family response regulator